jgi:hypothetical protein
MRASILIIANCFAIVASIMSYGVSMLHLLRGDPKDEQDRKRLFRHILLYSILFASLITILSFGLKHNIEILEQAGSFYNYAEGIQEVFYPIPYKNPPNLTFIKKVEDRYFTSGPAIIEQRADGFKVKLVMNSWHYDWKAVGIKKP